MPDLGSLITPCGRDKKIYFPAEDQAVSLGTMWDRGRHVASWVRSHGTRPLAVVLTNSSAAASTVVGAIAAGAELVSIPLPHRGADVGAYAEFVRHACSQVGASELMVDDRFVQVLPPLEGIEYVPFDAMLEWPTSGVGDPARFGLTQFTSGSTATPKGVVLTQERIAANIESIITVVAAEAGRRRLLVVAVVARHGTDRDVPDGDGSRSTGLGQRPGPGPDDSRDVFKTAPDVVSRLRRVRGDDHGSPEFRPGDGNDPRDQRRR